jgi:Schlafen group 3, DNA/RNA helicase domain
LETLNRASNMKAAYYQASISAFLRANPTATLGELAQSHGFALEQSQRDAWIEQIAIMNQALQELDCGHILFEFTIPRMGKRADVVLVLGCTIVVVEFKVGSTTFDRHAIEQVHDYALDLKNFHRGSHSVPIIPILVATQAKFASLQSLYWAADGVAQPLLANADQFKSVLDQAMRFAVGQPIDFNAWISSGYQPTPTIVEAAQALYQTHGVEEIARSDAGAQNLGLTSGCIAEIIERSKAQQRKSICFVTGVPGAGKTLAGLNIATKRAQEHSDEHAVFLSGNGPLVAVLREALARDESAREKTPKAEAHRRVASFIQNIHHFRDEAIRNPDAPHERVVIFDEAQRAWTRDQAVKFMRAKRSVNDFNMSEPQFLISVMDRHQGWCVVVCLVGGGQEINTGEAGLAEWLTALGSRFSHWDIYISNRLSDPDYVSNKATADLLKSISVRECPELHLSISMRSFRAEAFSSFVRLVIENRPDEARLAYAEIAERYPIWLTRNLDDARQWLRRQARGSERFGLLASSGGHRLRAEGIHVMAKIDAPTWFLNDPTDVRSSFYCEEVATEFDVQGLELDWTGVCWDADFRYSDGQWSHLNFHRTGWQQVIAAEKQLYLKNAYRVILTRARQGMIIFVPQGSAEDQTRSPAFYDQTFHFLRACGLPMLQDPDPAFHGAPQNQVSIAVAR